LSLAVLRQHAVLFLLVLGFVSLKTDRHLLLLVCDRNGLFGSIPVRVLLHLIAVDELSAFLSPRARYFPSSRWFQRRLLSRPRIPRRIRGRGLRCAEPDVLLVVVFLLLFFVDLTPLLFLVNPLVLLVTLLLVLLMSFLMLLLNSFLPVFLVISLLLVFICFLPLRLI
jgi:hypothetical protein